MLKFIKEGWYAPKYSKWGCTHCGKYPGAIAANGADGACLACAIREGIAIETVRTPRPNKKLIAYAEHFKDFETPCPDDNCENLYWDLPWREESAVCESLAYSNPRG